MKDYDSDLSHEQDEIISQERYTNPKEQKAFYEGFMLAADRADVQFMDTSLHFAKSEHRMMEIVFKLLHLSKDKLRK